MRDGVYPLPRTPHEDVAPARALRHLRDSIALFKEAVGIVLWTSVAYARESWCGVFIDLVPLREPFNKKSMLIESHTMDSEC